MRRRARVKLGSKIHRRENSSNIVEAATVAAASTQLLHRFTMQREIKAFLLDLWADFQPNKDTDEDQNN